MIVTQGAAARAHADEPSLAELAAALAPDEHALGLRERKKRARREALIDATHRLVERHGLDAVTVDAICEEAGVSTRTFFNYFESKDDAVLGHGPWPVPAAVSARFVAGGPTGDLLADLQELLGSVLAVPPMGEERFRQALELAATEPRLLACHLAWVETHKATLAELVTQRLATATGRRDAAADGGAHVAPDTVASLALLLIHATVMRWEAAGPRTDARQHLAAVVAELRTLFGASAPQH